MWIYMNDAFLSIVQDQGNPEHLLVRARRAGDIESALEAAMMGDPLKVTETLESDYRFRASVNRRIVAGAIASRLLAIRYPNFKNSVEDSRRAEVYSSVWLETAQGLDPRADLPGVEGEAMFPHRWEEINYMGGVEYMCSRCGWITEEKVSEECPMG